MGSEPACTDRNAQSNWSACLVTSCTWVFYGPMRMNASYSERCVHRLVSHWQLWKDTTAWFLKNQTQTHKHTQKKHIWHDHYYYNYHQRSAVPLLNLFSLQLHQSVSCHRRLENWSMVTGTLRTNLTSSSRFIFELCVRSFVCASDKENLSLCHFA